MQLGFCAVQDTAGLELACLSSHSVPGVTHPTWHDTQ